MDNSKQEQEKVMISEDEIKAARLAKKASKKAAKSVQIERQKLRLAKRPSQNTFLGQHKWLGGAVDEKTGKIYGIPSHAIEVICISTPEPGGTTSSDVGVDDDANIDIIRGEEVEQQAEISRIPLPNQYKEGNFKWLRGIIHNGYLYGIPAWSTHGVLKVRLQEKTRHTRGPRVKLLPLPHSPEYYQTTYEYQNEKIKRGQVEYNNIDRGRWMWHGGTIGASQSTGDAIYCVPSNAEHVLKVTLSTEAVEEIKNGPPLTTGQNKWYGGIKGKDGCIYGMPYTATGVLRIDPRTDSIQVLGDYPSGGYKWHGGLIAHSTGVIYAFPAHSNEVLCVDTNPTNSNNDNDDGNDNDDDDDDLWRVTTIPIHRHAEDTDLPSQNYKWLGGSYGADGCIYGMPSDATSILRIDPVANVATTFGKVSDAKNKWQGGVLSKVDNCVYAVPADHDCILRIDTNPDSDTHLRIDFVGSGFQDVEDKWQGAFCGRDNKQYAIPENCDNVMVITPDKKNPSVTIIT